MSIIIVEVTNELLLEVTKFYDFRHGNIYQDIMRCMMFSRWMYLRNQVQLLKITKEGRVETYICYFKHIQLNF
jgi:hypothetical protein